MISDNTGRLFTFKCLYFNIYYVIALALIKLSLLVEIVGLNPRSVFTFSQLYNLADLLLGLQEIDLGVLITCSGRADKFFVSETDNLTPRPAKKVTVIRTCDHL